MMKRGPKTLLLAGASLFLAAHSSEAVINFVGITVPWIQQAGNPQARAENGDTIGGNSQWNVYLRPVGGAFLNSGNGASTRFTFALEAGKTYNFEAVLQDTSWVDNSVPKPGSYLNLYFNGNLDTPGISAKLAGGNTGALSALTAADIAQIKNDNGGLAAPAGSLSFQLGGERVTLSAFSQLVTGDSVQAFNDLPSGSGGDSILRFTVGVIPEPSSTMMALIGLLGLIARRRR